jgi:hypothetical protein
MHTYRHSFDALEEFPSKWETGLWITHKDGNYWRTVASFDAEWKAALYASFLNGGKPPIGVLNELFAGANISFE